MSGIHFINSIDYNLNMKNKISLRKIFFNLILFLLAYYLGFTFISASLDKIADPYTFSNDILNYEIIPYWIVNLSALFLPWIELVCGLLLLFAILLNIVKNIDTANYIDSSNNIIILMLFWFILILSVAHFRGLDIDCGCGLGESKTLPLDRLKEDIYLLIIAFIIKFRGLISNFLYKNDIERVFK